MERRTFIAAFAASGAFGWLTAGGLRSGAATLDQTYPHPVPFVTDPAAAGVTPAEAASYFAVDAAATLDTQSKVYPQSVASGDPQANGIVLWTRVDPALQNGQSVVAWQISSAITFDAGAVVISGLAQVDAARDNTVKLPVAHPALHPFTTYYYRFIMNGVASRTGRFKTLPAPTDTPAHIRLGYVVCQDYGHGYYTALQYLATEDVDYVVHLGDYIYETIANPAFQSNPVRPMPPFPSGPNSAIPQSVDDYRFLYKIYKSDANQQAVHENFAYIQLWDDHEFANDCHQDFHPDNTTNPDAPEPGLRQAANQAWSEYGLADVPFDSTKGWNDSIQLYRKFSFGNLLDLVVTDERLYRDGPPCGNSQAFERYFSLGCEGLGSATRTMLGAAQRQWFLSQITQSKATWKLWANEVMLMQLKIAGVVYVDLDQWDGYPKERAAILSAIGNAGVKNFVAITGDLHTFLAGYLKPDFNNLLQAPVGIELMVGSITSANLAEDIEAAIHLPSSPLPAKNFGVPPNLLEPLIRVNNPHIQYWDSSTHGYGILDITPSQLVCTFKAVTTIQAPTARLVQLKTFTIPAGRVHLQQS